MWAKSLGSAELALLLAAMLGGAPGCAHTQEPPAACTSPEPLRVTLKGTPRLNLGEKGEALATVVRLYQLKATTRLTGASFDELMDHDHDALGDDFVSVQEVTLSPGERLNPSLARGPDATFLAAVALFREPAGIAWRAFAKLPPPDPQHCHQTGGDAPGVRATARSMQFLLDENRIELR
jgi:type VI secretion system VasD/TssJ family lipoprotein